MRFLIDIAIAFLVAVVTGVASASVAVDRAPLFNPLRIAEWTAWSHAGGVDADPYDLAALARKATLSLGSGEGLAFTATSDDGGLPLDGACTYTLAGNTPPARVWTLTAYDGADRVMGTATGPATLTSRRILRRTDGTFEITAAPTVQPGNWLATTATSRLTLVLRLYDTPLTSPVRPTTLAMPAIRRLRCR